MRRHHNHRQAVDSGNTIDLTPMLDVVFILLIFFLVAASFIKQPGVEVDRANALMGQHRHVAVLVAVNAHDDVWIDGHQVPDARLKLEIRRLYSENPQGGLVIQADERSSLETVLRVSAAARAAGVANVSIATERL